MQGSSAARLLSSMPQRRAVEPDRSFLVRGRAPGPMAPVDLKGLASTIGWLPISEAEREDGMKFVCLGYLDESRWNALSEGERTAIMDACFAYDDELRRNGHFVGGEALQGAPSAVTLRYRNNTVSATDGPYAETKEILGGILFLEAEDLDHAVRLMSKHPGVKVGPFEIRPAEDLGEFMRASEARRLSVARPR